MPLTGPTRIASTTTAVGLGGDEHGHPTEFIWAFAPGEDINRADIETEATGFAHVFADHHFPSPGVFRELLLFGLEQRHLPLPTRYQAWAATRAQAITSRTDERCCYLHRQILS
jgi:hypothetical protein